MNGSGRDHWDRVYETKQPTEVSWYRPHLETSLELIERAAPDPRSASAVIDVGGGESTLVDDLLARGFTDVTVLDISAAALEGTKARLGAAATRVQWLAGDVTEVALPEARYDVWHDRAVFHFLTDSAHRAAYVRQVARAVRVGGHVIVGAFGPDGPTRCSGLEVVRYGANELHEQFGRSFELLAHLEEAHRTPAGRDQQFVWCFCRVKTGEASTR
jgi:SAM-dependent methyltransferase